MGVWLALVAGACAPGSGPEGGAEGDVGAEAQVAEVCPPALVDDIVACVDDWLADPDNTLTAAELLVACADAEPLADAIDAWCAEAQPAPDACAGDYEAVWSSVSAPCMAAATAVFEG